MTGPPPDRKTDRSSLAYIKETRSKLIPKMQKEVSPLEKQVNKNVADIKGDIKSPTTRYHPDTPTGKATDIGKSDHTRVASPQPRVPSTSEKLRETLAHKDEPKSSVARGSRQVAANKLADKIMKERRGDK